MKTSSIEPSEKLPRPLKPVSPLLDEAAIIAQLATACTLESSEYMRVAAFFSIIDVHDRQLLRPAVVQTAHRAVTLIEHLRRAETLALVYHDLLPGKHTLQKICEPVGTVIAEHLVKADEIRQTLHADMKLVAECAYEADPIN